MRELKGRSESIFIVTVIFLGISFLAVCLRCFVRLRLVRAFGWDDTLMVFAMVCGSMLFYSLERRANGSCSSDTGIEHPFCVMRNYWCTLRYGTEAQRPEIERH